MKLCTSVGGVEGGDFMAYFFLSGWPIAGDTMCFLFVLLFLWGGGGGEVTSVEPSASSLLPTIQIDLALHRHAVYS